MIYLLWFSYIFTIKSVGCSQAVSQVLFEPTGQYDKDGVHPVVKVDPDFTPSEGQVIKLSLIEGQTSYVRVDSVEQNDIAEGSDEPVNSIITASFIDIESRPTGYFLIYLRDKEYGLDSSILVVSETGNFHASLDRSGAGPLVKGKPPERYH